MADNPCQKEWNDFRKATIEWTHAGDATKAFIVVEPLTPDKDVELRPSEYYERMKRAYDQEAAARKNYFEKLAALQECEQKHSQ